MSRESKRAVRTATELMKAMTRLRARLRIQSAPVDMPLTWSQLTTLDRVVKEGPTTASALAQAEHVRRQSMAETIAALRANGLISSGPDASDARKSLIQATSKGQELSKTIPAAREAWLNTVISESLTAEERQTLSKAAALMNRMADRDL
jgi:DNA-binding MarR family transcriptional regulator